MGNAISILGGFEQGIGRCALLGELALGGINAKDNTRFMCPHKLCFIHGVRLNDLPTVAVILRWPVNKVAVSPPHSIRSHLMNRFLKYASAMVIVAGLAGCGGSTTTTPSEDSSVSSTETSTDTTTTAETVAPSGIEFERGDHNNPASMLATKIVYFDFDQAEIRGDAREIIEAHGRYLAQFPDIQVRLEGHADERGTREYNIGLGERRAIAVQRLLLLQGVTNTQVNTVSYGEEVPAALGQSESAWSQNRRVEFVY